MLIPGDAEPETFFLALDSSTGEIYCAHQEFLAVEREGEMYLAPSHATEDSVLDTAVKANPMARAARDRLTVARVTADPSIDFSRYRFDLDRGELVEGETVEADTTDTRIAFRDGPTGQ